MITMLIMAFGLLALAYMETWGFKFGQDSEARSQAMVIAYDLMDRMRVTGVRPTSASASAYSSSITGAIDCSPTTVSAENDRNCFFTTLNERIPGSAASISIVSASTPATYRITIAWIDQFSERFAASGETPTIAECTSKELMASGDSNGLIWYPTSSKPATNVCLNFVSWSMAP